MRPLHKLIAFACALVFVATFVPNPLHPHPVSEQRGSERAIAPRVPADEALPHADLTLDKPRPRGLASERDSSDSPLPKRRDPRAGRPEATP
jgi:hypothetical protein